MNIIIHIIAQLKLNLLTNTYITSSKEINEKDPKYKIGNIFRTSKYKNMLLVILKEKKLLESFSKKNCKKKTNQKSFELKR